MKTEDFIRELAIATPPPAPKVANLVAYGLTGLVFGAVAFVGIGGVRPDLGDAWLPTGLKVAFGFLSALAIAPLLLRIARPSLSAGRAAIWPVPVLALAAVVSVAGLTMTAEPVRWALWTNGGVPDCLWQIPLIAAPAGAGLMLGVRRFGPTRLGLAGLTIGAITGALAAIPYSLFCPIDFAPYVATWYTAAFGLCALLGFLAGTRFLRW